MNEIDHIEDNERATRSRGATAVEYAMIVALIAAVIILAVTTLGASTQGMYQDVETELDNQGV